MDILRRRQACDTAKPTRQWPWNRPWSSLVMCLISVSMVRVGQKAPDFEAPAFVDGAFKNVKLSDYLGHWVVLCFYPGDFTFV